MASREYAGMWARQVRGLTFAERAVLQVLAYFSDDVTGRARVSMGTLIWRFEASRQYIREIIHTLSWKGFISIEEQFDKRGLQETNLFKLNTHRIFPLDPVGEKGFHGYEKGMKILRAILRDITADPDLKFTEAWVKQVPKRHNQRAKPILFVAVSSDDHFKVLTNAKFELMAKIKTLAPWRLDLSDIVAVKMYADRRGKEF